ncbi:MAG: TlpA family protein disulfide reductase [Flavobacteriaceae bacterium]|nr:TlpA family protein disulfide reductase [Flavobacteriaceae bacterium]
MKNLPILSLVFTTLFSCAQNEKPYVLFSGHINNNKETIIEIANSGKSFQKEVAIDSIGNFKDTLYIDRPGSYYYQIGKAYSTVFFKPGYDLTVSIDADDFYRSTKYTGKGSEVNNYNVARGTLKSQLVGDAKTFFVVPVDDFLLKIQKNKEAFLELLENSGLSGKDKELQLKIIEYDYLLTRNNYDKFYAYHTKEHPELPVGYYEPIKQMDMDDEEAFENIQSYRILITESWRLHLKDAKKKNPSLSVISHVESQIKDIKSPKIRDLIVSMLFKQMTLKNENYEADYPKIMTMLTDDKMKEKLTTRYNSVRDTKPEMAAPEFNYENHIGGTTSLKDLKGKIVYIEIWATWCGPCVKEMPALTQLIKDFKDKNIEFVSISIDSKNDYDKWRKMVPEKNVGGIQLLADKGLKSDFMLSFSVGLIPRSILLDEEGKIITDKAPRPSAENTKDYLDSLLTRNKTTKL